MVNVLSMFMQTRFLFSPVPRSKFQPPAQIGSPAEHRVRHSFPLAQSSVHSHWAIKLDTVRKALFSKSAMVSREALEAQCASVDVLEGPNF